MKAVVFNGVKEARRRERELALKVREMRRKPRLLTVVCEEDEMGLKYTQLKMEAAVRVGIEFDRVVCSFGDGVGRLREVIGMANRREDVQGVMVQKPGKRVWMEKMGVARDAGAFDNWWRSIANNIDPRKDVDCLNQVNLEKVYAAGEWRILPATVKAVLSILGSALGAEGSEGVRGELGITPPTPTHKVMEGRSNTPFYGGENVTLKGGKWLEGRTVAVIGRSDIVGRPLAAVLGQMGAKVYLLGSKTEDLGTYTCSSDVIVSATGVPGLVKEDIVPYGAVVIDVGSPYGDVDFEGVEEKAAFITPVPDGVGPMTVVSLLENLVEGVI